MRTTTPRTATTTTTTGCSSKHARCVCERRALLPRRLPHSEAALPCGADAADRAGVRAVGIHGTRARTQHPANRDGACTPRMHPEFQFGDLFGPSRVFAAMPA